MEAGFATRVGLGGRPVSGGQRQRIALARALLKDGSLVLLDEATSALDSVTETRVQEELERILGARPRTTLIVAHRISTVQRADRIMVLEMGRLVGFAPHEELLRTCDLYRRLVEKQQILREPSSSLAAAAS